MKKQSLPVVLTVVVFGALCFILYGFILLLNRFTATDIALQIRWSDVLVGLTIYLKTSVDFAILIGNLMASYDGVKNRIAIEIGTAFGNALGTLIVLAIWNFFRDVEWLLAIMIFIAALVLLRLAQDGFEHVHDWDAKFPVWFKKFSGAIELGLKKINSFFEPMLRHIVPHATLKPKKRLAFMGLFAASFTIPFILGLDDFAGYVPLFSIVNVFGFAIGVFAGHMVLNMALFISPKKTITAVKNPLISFAGSIVFFGLAVWGFYEVYMILFLH
mgnify:CR=1 FL=1